MTDSVHFVFFCSVFHCHAEKSMTKNQSDTFQIVLHGGLNSDGTFLCS